MGEDIAFINQKWYDLVKSTDIQSGGKGDICMKVLMILVDGMRPESMVNIPQAQKLLAQSAFTMKAVTVMPSMTLPCHMSLFHSVDPSRHGTATNTYAPQVRPVRGLCEVLRSAGKSSAFFYDWEQLRDLTRPGDLDFSYFAKGERFGYAVTDRMVTNAAIDYMGEHAPDFAFLYLGDSDEEGHRYGWMSEEYLAAIRRSWEHIERILAVLAEKYAVIVLADHGGHDRTHGTNGPEDMTIPLMIRGDGFVPGSEFDDASIMDIAPTVAQLLGVECDREWEGRSLVK